MFLSGQNISTLYLVNYVFRGGHVLSYNFNKDSKMFKNFPKIQMERSVSSFSYGGMM